MKIKNKFKRLVAVACLAATTAGIAGAASWRENILVDVNKVTVVSNQKTIQEPTLLWNDKTYIPLRATLEAAGCRVDWDQSTYTATVSNRYAALADVMWKSYQFSSILFDYYKCTDALQNVLVVYTSDYTDSYRESFAAPILSSASSIAFSASEYVRPSAVEQDLLLGTNGWDSLIPEFRAIHADIQQIALDFNLIASLAQDVKHMSYSDIASLQNRLYDCQSSINSLMIRISNYMTTVSNQMVYDPPLH